MGNMDNIQKAVSAPNEIGALNLPDERNEIPVQARTPAWKRIVPFLVAGGILLYLFRQTDMRQCFDALLGADILAYVPWLIVFILVWFLLDTHFLALLLRHFQHPVTFKSAMNIRGVTYLLMTIDYTLGLSALIYFLKRDAGVSFMRSTGLTFFFSSLTQKSLVYLTIIGLLLLSPDSSVLHHFLIFMILFAIADLVFIIVLKALPDHGLIDKFKRLNVVKVFHEASWKSYAVLIFWRIVYYVLFIAFFYIAVRAFHMVIPLIALIAYVPVILLIISMPITPCGFGTAQAAMIYLFKDYGTDGNIMAFGLTYSTSILVLRSLIGLCFVRNITGLPSRQTENL